MLKGQSALNSVYLPENCCHKRKWSAAIYLFKVNNGDTRVMCEIWSKLTKKTTVPFGSILSFERVNAGLVVHIINTFTKYVAVKIIQLFSR